MTNDKGRKKSEARIPKGARVCDRRTRHSDFGIPSDFLIRHSSFGFGNCGTWRAPFRFLRMHWDHEPGPARSAGFPACGFTGHSCPVFLLLATGKSPEPADRNVCPTYPRFMERPLLAVSHALDHEP